MSKFKVYKKLREEKLFDSKPEVEQVLFLRDAEGHETGMTVEGRAEFERVQLGDEYELKPVQ